MEQFIADLLVDLQMDASLSALVASFLVWAPLAGFTALFFGFLYFTRNFNDHITYTGNVFEPTLGADGAGFRLLLRTFRIMPQSDVLPSNAWFRVALLFALARTTKKDPFIRMSARDMDVLQPSIINGFSELFAEGLANRQAGRSVSEAEFLLAISYEKHDGAKSRKIRVIITTEDELSLVSNPAFLPQVHFERSHQGNRLITLAKMAEHWASEADTSLDDVRIVRPITVYTVN